jgi:hypothetical protein
MAAEMSRELHVDQTYRNTNNWQDPRDVFNRFFRFTDGKGINNTSGFRPKSKARGKTDITASAFCVLVTNFGESEWPDSIDRENGVFTYYGDNRSAEKLLHDTVVGGNRLLEKTFGQLHAGERGLVPPFLGFEKIKAAKGTHMRFLGLLCPGAPSLSGLEDLVAVWRMHGDLRFQNYRAVFTILKAGTVPHDWLEDLVLGVAPTVSSHCPRAWRTWVESGRYSPLQCTRAQQPRTRAEQMPRTPEELRLLQRVFDELTPREFEFLGAALLPMIDERFVDLAVTKAVRDGGRDVLAKYRVGHDSHQVLLEACLEAKRWRLDSAVGVKPMMRLLSRLKHRDLGVFVTSSFFETQVQRELIEDRHPVLLVSGGDIARILTRGELGGPGGSGRLEAWLERIRATARGDSSG